MDVSTKPRPAAPARPSARERILAAAGDIAHEVGPANMSLDAVAARAGVSKGGLLYHFPAKAQLLEALIVDHLRHFEQELGDHRNEKGGLANILRSYLDVSMVDCARKAPPASGVLAAIVQHPEMMAPITRFKRQMLDRLKADAGEESTALILFLAMEGMRSMKLFNADILSAEETGRAVEALCDLIDSTRRPANPA
ncbi:TetR/AcrR family transcriptional regulator [Mesorhizobium sp. LHD-90]|uniref:TetR/AcrR family transcriptional regulator n=1 Tax=Mesorhizobium sp. LHD-90 TaxID=3071414 RepID=UPI0027E200A8|nr:TetR/AcrR family transcriptional regulator [Mesorhizobium sp. LHD-90]MDQ6436960.1 TetR/AcrR family transcriptional regulator [Mesorhizobium sp. LHD-90]